MQLVVQALPILLLAVIVALVLRSALRGRIARQRPARPRKSNLRIVSRSQMDEDLKDLIRRS
jgi:hypothetical protein